MKKTPEYFDFRTSVDQSMISLARKPKAGGHKKGFPPVATKRRGNELSVLHEMQLQNCGAHWQIFQNCKGGCKACTKKGWSQGHIVNVLCVE